MTDPKNRTAPDASSTQGRPPRESSEVEPVKPQENAALETYEQSPERQGADERNTPATPDGPMPDRERAIPD